MMVLRLYAKILMHSFVAGSIDEVFDQFSYGAVDIKMLSFLTQSLAAVATCVRTASLTRYYINHGLNADRKIALKESLKEIFEGIVDVLKSDELKQAWEKFHVCSSEVSKAVAEDILKYAKSMFDQNEKVTETPIRPEVVTNH